MTRRVLLYNPPSEFYSMPLGLVAVGSALPAPEFDVRIYDSRIDAGAAGRLIEDAAGACCVGMTVFSGSPIRPALELSRQLKQRYPQLPVVWGGWHPSILPEQCIGSGAVDAVVIGQGEATFAELVRAIEDRRRWSSIPGLALGGESSPVRTPPRPLVDMNSFPRADYELLDVESYFRHKGARQVDFSSSRGCPYRCTFCADPIIYKSKWTALRAERTVDELLRIHARYRMDEVSFLDDDLFASLKRIRALAEAFIDRKAPFGWKGTARADELCRLPEEFFPRLRQSGCRRITIGAESGSQKILDRIKKEYRVDEIVTAGRRAAAADIAVSFSCITGFPGETEADFGQTLEVIKQVRDISPKLEATIYFYSKYPGTELVAELQKRNSRLPERLEDWADFSIDDAWLPDARRLSKRVESLNFYLRHAYTSAGSGAIRALLRIVSRLRCDNDWSHLALEPYLARLIRSASG